MYTHTQSLIIPYMSSITSRPRATWHLVTHNRGILHLIARPLGIPLLVIPQLATHLQ